MVGSKGLILICGSEECNPLGPAREKWEGTVLGSRGAKSRAALVLGMKGTRPSGIAHYPRPPPWGRTQQGLQIGEILNGRGRQTWQGKPFNLKKIAFIRTAYKLPSRHERLRRCGLLTTGEMAL
jgi:hypothetical protein